MKLRAVGDRVVLKKMLLEKEITRKGIVIPEKLTKGFNMGRAEVLSVGPDAKFEGLKVGDIVRYDYYSVFDDSQDVVITKVENIIYVEE